MLRKYTPSAYNSLIVTFLICQKKDEKRFWQQYLKCFYNRAICYTQLERYCTSTAYRACLLRAAVQDFEFVLESPRKYIPSSYREEAASRRDEAVNKLSTYASLTGIDANLDLRPDGLVAEATKQQNTANG